LYIKENTNKSYTFNITVTKVGGTEKYENITGKLYFGYKAPIVGDFAYSDGSFSSVLFTGDDKTLIGMVYQVEEIVAGSQWKLCILGTESITGYLGADFYGYNESANGWAKSDTYPIAGE
jgi:hypothetical protein